MTKNQGAIEKFQFVLISLLLILSFESSLFAQTKAAPAKTLSVTRLTAGDEAFLEDLEHRTFLYFWEQSDSQTGLTLDRSRADGSPLPANHPSHNIASSAATGFALTALCIAVDRNWITPAEAQTRARRTLDFFANRAVHKNGWFYHWIDRETGERRWQSEISSIDTALLLGGVLTVRQCFASDQEIVRLATKIYERVDFPWMLNGDKFLLSHGWRPETGFIAYRWKNYSENAVLYLLAIGSPSHPLAAQSWYAWKRDFITYGGYKYQSGAAPLFIHQYSQAWFDLRNKRERAPGYAVNYFDNSAAATRAHRQFCLDLKKEFPGYSENVWGISASDSDQGYLAWGGPPRDPAIDGTVVPYAAGGSLMFTPDIALPALKEIKQRFGSRVYTHYGFVDAFNPNNDWTAPDVLGIDAGITLLSAENLRSGKIWNWFMQNKESKNALLKAKIW